MQKKFFFINILFFSISNIFIFVRPCLKRTHHSYYLHPFHDSSKRTLFIGKYLKLVSELFAYKNIFIRRINDKNFEINANVVNVPTIDIIDSSSSTVPRYAMFNGDLFSDTSFLKNIRVTLHEKETYIDIRIVNKYSKETVVYSWNTKISFLNTLKNICNSLIITSVSDYAKYIKNMYYKNEMQDNKFEISHYSLQEVLYGQDKFLKILIPFQRSCYQYLIPYRYDDEPPAVIEVLFQTVSCENILKVVYARKKNYNEKNVIGEYVFSSITRYIDETSIERIEKFLKLDSPEQIIDDGDLQLHHYTPHTNGWKKSLYKENF